MSLGHKAFAIMIGGALLAAVAAYAITGMALAAGICFCLGGQVAGLFALIGWPIGTEYRRQCRLFDAECRRFDAIMRAPRPFGFGRDGEW